MTTGESSAGGPIRPSRFPAGRGAALTATRRLGPRPAYAPSAPARGPSDTDIRDSRAASRWPRWHTGLR
jgi:hypothetical protein